MSSVPHQLGSTNQITQPDYVVKEPVRESHMGSIAEEPQKERDGQNAFGDNKVIEETKSSSSVKEQSILQAKLTKLAVQIGYAGKLMLDKFISSANCQSNNVVCLTRVKLVNMYAVMTGVSKLVCIYDNNYYSN